MSLFIKSLKQCCDSYESSALSNILIGLGHDYGLHRILLISNQTAPIWVHVDDEGLEPTTYRRTPVLYPIELITRCNYYYNFPIVNFIVAIEFFSFHSCTFLD